MEALAPQVVELDREAADAAKRALGDDAPSSPRSPSSIAPVVAVMTLLVAEEVRGRAGADRALAMARESGDPRLTRALLPAGDRRLGSGDLPPPRPTCARRWTWRGWRGSPRW